MTSWDNLQKLRRKLREEGTGTTARRLGHRAAQWLDSRVDAESLAFPLLTEDIRWENGRTETLTRPQRVPVAPDGAAGLHLGWVCVPPALGSGGHTTLFRMVRMAERLGYRCTLFLYDTTGTSVDHHAAVIRRGWPDLRADVKSARPAISGVDAVVAGSWETAHVVVSRSPESIPKFYFIQDYEPFFYARGPLWTLAEHSYHLGLTTIALGQMVAGSLRTFAEVEPHLVVPFGCDTDTYRLRTGDEEPRAREGIVFYAKPGAARRGFSLGRDALRHFHREHPDVPIHAVGDTPSGSLGFDVISHGSLAPSDLNELYNSVQAGLALSFTNISLVAEEMLAAGVVPVVNESAMARADLPQSGPVWAIPTPQGISDSLWTTVSTPRSDADIRFLSQNARQGWDATASRVVEFIAGSVDPSVRPLLCASVGGDR
ncbi:hypothetical protein GA0111570_1042 [Raineyella antarctica]|uniref:WsaF C-terminal domain-containing protein n=1 Tax=Raineyella antarctica TaxID=1577474 RepID=A0A1G6GKT0_9ACTN|nr:glycosyltransferase family 4 protein [Raineyella antarctica]SDB82453.1 hypothetical protein GA0111570_1042 [Raineyella antarctica]